MNASANPLLQPWSTPYGLAPFAQVRPEHFEPALEATMAEHRSELDAIANQSAAPDFDNTIAALDRSGRALARVESLLNNLTSAETSATLQEVDRRVQPKLAAHHHAVRTDARLFARIVALHQSRESLGLDAESLRLIERLHLDFVRTGARLAPEARARLAEIAEQKSTLCTQFEQNVLADESSYALVLSREEELAGLPTFLRDAAQTAARERGIEGGWAITLSRSLIVPFLTYSERRDLRETAFRAWVSRGEGEGTTDNRGVAQKILALRAEQAKLHGYDHFSQYALVDRMAKEPARALELLRKVWGPARARALRERDALAEEARALGHTHEIEPWDWRFFAEKVRKRRYALDETELKAYFSLDRMIEAMFDCANKLFGLRFDRREDLVAYHPDVRVYEVFARDGNAVGLFLSDNYARPSKMGGAWMSEHRLQSRNGGETLPIIANHNNFAKGSPTLLSLDDVKTLFHEFGHGLHGLLSNVRYRRLSGTNVLQDFVELPSQIFEHWIEQPAVLRQHARHFQTGEPIPETLVARAKQARTFNQGFETVEYTACALLDLALHSRDDAEGVDITAFEREELARIEMPREIVLRHRLPHFTHLFAGDGYAAGYYVYLWAEVLDADGFDAFIEAGDIFDPAVASRLLRYVYSAGNTIEPGAAYRAFRGRDPEVAPLLAKRGLVDDNAHG
ncbi:MAG: M3 family metallopeptidase [Deltaproteobacteria bacterium]|nr:M3 family metallopeptidase [Deltaproteobacteria bacterium]